MPAVAVGTDIYVIGGYVRTGLSASIERIDTKTDTVSPVSAEILPRGFHTAEAIGDAIYIFGGAARDEGFVDFSDKVERFDTLTQKVTLVASLPDFIRIPASVAVGDKIYIVGGSNYADKRLNSLWIYDSQTNKWAPGAPMHVAREGDVIAVGGTIYAFGGFDGTNAITDCEAYDIASNTWHDLPPLPIKTSANHFAQFGDSIWSFGDYTDMNRVQRFDLKTQTWQPLNATGFDARRHMAVCSVGDKIYVIGGNIASGGSYLDEVQVFDATKLK